MKVEQFEDVKNQFLLRDDYGNRYFQSYNSIIVKIDNKGKVTLDERYWDYSTTTGKYRNRFLGEDKKETQRKIDNGQYALANLNERD